MKWLKNLYQDRHRWLTWFWIVMVIPTLLWWRDSILWVLIISLYANIETSAGAKEAKKARTNK